MQVLDPFLLSLTTNDVILCNGGNGLLKSFVYLQCISLQKHTGRVFRLQFDDFQIISSSHDDTILIWDFLNVVAPDPVLPAAGGSTTSSVVNGDMEVDHSLD